MATCDAGHALVRVSRGGYECDTCDREGLSGPRAHCEPCEYDLCAACEVSRAWRVSQRAEAAAMAGVAKCDEGHPLARVSGGGFECNACERTGIAGERLHCNECDYDLCRECEVLYCRGCGYMNPRVGPACARCAQPLGPAAGGPTYGGPVAPPAWPTPTPGPAPACPRCAAPRANASGAFCRSCGNSFAAAAAAAAAPVLVECAGCGVPRVAEGDAFCRSCGHRYGTPVRPAFLRHGCGWSGPGPRDACPQCGASFSGPGLAATPAQQLHTVMTPAAAAAAGTPTPAAAARTPGYEPTPPAGAVNVGIGYQINPIHKATTSGAAQPAPAVARPVLPPAHPDARIDHRKVGGAATRLRADARRPRSLKCACCVCACVLVHVYV